MVWSDFNGIMFISSPNGIQETSLFHLIYLWARQMKFYISYISYWQRRSVFITEEFQDCIVYSGSLVDLCISRYQYLKKQRNICSALVERNQSIRRVYVLYVPWFFWVLFLRCTSSTLFSWHKEDQAWRVIVLLL